MPADNCLKSSCAGLVVITILVISSMLLLSMIPHDTTAQPSTHFYIISGTIFDGDENGVPNATVELLNPETGEIIVKESNDLGNYSANLANFQEGWEDGQEIIITAYKDVFFSVSIYPDSTADGEAGAGMEVNITLPFLIIIAPESSEKIVKKDEGYIVRIEFLPTINLSYISYLIDDVEFANTTQNSTQLITKDFKDGTHKLKVVLTDTSGGTPQTKEIFFTLESEDDGMNIDGIIIVILVVVVIGVIGIVLYMRNAKQKPE